MLQHEAHEEMVEGGGAERQPEEVRLHELHVGQTRLHHLALCCGDGAEGEVDRDDPGTRAPAGKRDRLGADATSGFQDEAAVRVGGVGMEKRYQGIRLILEAYAL